MPDTDPTHPPQLFQTVALGTIVSVQGTNPGPASGITYTVRVNTPSGGTTDIAGVRPSNGRYPDTIDTAAATPGKQPAFVFFIGADMFFLIPELPAIAGCP